MAYALGRKKDSEDEWKEITWMGTPCHLPIQQLEYFVRLIRENFPENEYVVKQEGEK